jgi:regulator of nonsense transcripts 2
MPHLPTTSHKSDSIQIGLNANAQAGHETDEALATSGGKWEDEEERKFYEDIQDLKDFVPKSVLGINANDEEKPKEDEQAKKKAEKPMVEEDIRKLQEELEGLRMRDGIVNGSASSVGDDGKAGVNGDGDDDE